MKTDNNVNEKIGAPSLYKPWWKEPYIWMVISGPLSAVVACVITALYVFQGPDAVMPEEVYPKSLEISKEVSGALPSMQPAQTGRNHSATEGIKHESP